FVEGDCSSAAFLDAFNLLGGKVTVNGLNSNTLQGDSIYKKFYSCIKDGVRNFDLSDCPDLSPVMFALCSHIGEFTFTGTKRLKIKESDREECMKQELEKFGAKVEIFENEVKIYGGNLKKPSEILCGHNDHRIVMALSVLCSYYGGKIDGANAVSKGFPDFFEKIKELGVEYKYYET
ncbi:MAG: 3-phosphoshikimate 1-carboxyvinyltransferase, partial [Clostridia bacterium]|nr:3-phosphoshikimate 1-carboxyvinyltransferase [Clostridia bacterium]